MPSLDLSWIRSQFPALHQTIDDYIPVFADGPGGTQVPQRVLDAMRDYLIRANANTHGAFATSRRSDEILANAHQAAADLLGCDSREVIFGANMTSLTFAMSRAIGRGLQAGDEIIVTRLDHDANVAPWRALEERGVVVKAADIHVEDCTLDMQHLRAQITERTKVVAVGYASNASGSINDVRTIVQWAHEAGALAYVDAVHYAPHGPIDVRELDCDFLACSAYKFFGPHVGILYGKAEHLTRLQPYKVRPAPEQIPDRWETGTQNHEGLAGVVAAMDYLAEVGERFGDAAPHSSRRGKLLAAMRATQAYERGLSEQLIPALLDIPGLELHGIRAPEQFTSRTPTAAIRLAGASPQEVATYLAGKGIFVWDGNYYALNLSERLGVEETGGMVRIGFAHYNTPEEVSRVVEALRAFSQG